MGSPARSNKAALIGAVFIAAVVVWGILNVNFSREKAIDAGDIDVVIGGLGSHGQPVPNFIRGSFMVSTPMIKRRTIKSQGTGGACLVANLNILNPGQPGMSTPGKIENPDTGTPKRPCLKNSDCQRFLNPGWAGYCDEGTGICWVRPGTAEELCNRSIDYTPPKIWQDGFKNPTPKTPHHFPVLSPAPIEWRVLACLNKLGSTDRHCGDPVNLDGENKLQVFGKIKAVPYKPSSP